MEANVPMIAVVIAASAMLKPFFLFLDAFGVIVLSMAFMVACVGVKYSPLMRLLFVCEAF